MSVKALGRGFALIGVVLLLGGCASTTPIHDAEYAPVYPEVPQIPPGGNGSIYQSGHGMGLFDDPRARRVGDLLTVILTERTDASKSASTSTTKDQDIDMPTPTLFGMPVTHNGREIMNNSVDMGRDFSGDGASSQSNSLAGEISVSVAQVLPNGNLIVRGEKVLTLNQGDEFIRLSGIVRAVDITPANTIESTKLANARITYGGSGAVADSNKMGWLGRFFNGQLWPF